MARADQLARFGLEDLQRFRTDRFGRRAQPFGVPKAAGPREVRERLNLLQPREMFSPQPSERLRPPAPADVRPIRPPAPVEGLRRPPQPEAGRSPVEGPSPIPIVLPPPTAPIERTGLPSPEGMPPIPMIPPPVTGPGLERGDRPILPPGGLETPLVPRPPAPPDFIRTPEGGRVPRPPAPVNEPPPGMLPQSEATVPPEVLERLNIGQPTTGQPPASPEQEAAVAGAREHLNILQPTRVSGPQPWPPPGFASNNPQLWRPRGLADLRAFGR